MEAQDQPGSTAAPADGPVPAPSLQPAPGPGSAAPRQDPAPSQPLYLKALTVPLYQPLQAGCWQPRGPLVTGRSCVHLESSNVPLILNPLLPSEGTDQPHSLFPKQLGQTLTLNIVSTLPVLSSPNSCVNASTGSLGKPKKAGKYVCKHCGRDCLKPSVLEKHIRSHTGERPFPCTTCGIAFKTQSNLYKHRRTQTHVNNTRAPPDSDSSSAAEQNGRSTESTGTHRGSKLRGGTGGDKGGQMEQASSESSAATKRLPKDLPPPAASNPPFASENQEMANPSSSPKANQGVPEREPERLPSPGALPNGQCQRKKLREQRTPSANKHLQLQRQQATSWDKPWDCRACESQLKKCESTDSGYLSRSDSAELASPGPLQGLGQPGAEPEGQPGLRSPARPEPAQRAAASVLEKKRLEEHISKLISHNKSVVDDTHLDNVRPRKTVLSKQGSIDLPMPYTYKDSFHFDIRTCDVNRKKNLSLCSAKSTFAPLEKCKPVFFHSVPTQFSTTIDTVPVTRSNSLPVAERDRAGGSQPPSLGRPPPNPPRAAALLPASDPPASSLDLPSSHPRALVRQAAVDDLPLGGAAEPPAPPEELQGGHRPGAGAGTAARNKRDNQKKLKMFSHEKWQMYGDETFKKIYQKMKSSQNAKKTKQRGNKITDITSFTPDSKESVSSIEIPEQRDGRSSTSDSVPPLLTTGLKPGTSETCANGDRAVQSLSPGDNADSFPCAMETSHPANAPAQTVRSRTSPELGDSDTGKHRSDNSTSPAPGTCELGLKNPRCRLNASGRNDDRLPAESSEWGNPGEGSSACESESKSTSNADGSQSRSEGSGQPALTPPGAHCNSTREAAGKSQNLPSERKKLKFEVEKAPDVIAKPCPSPSSEGRVGNEAEQVQVRCSSAQRVATAPLAPRKAQEEKLSTGINESGGGTEHVEYMKTITLPPKALNYGDVNPLSHSAGISKASFVGFLGPEFRGSDCNSSALHNATDTDVKTCLVKTGAKAPLFDAVDVSSKIHHLQSGHLTPIPQQNAFPPKYILTLPQDKRASDLSLSLRPEEQIPPCTPVTDTSATPPRSATSRALGSHPEDGAWSPAKPEVRQKATNGELRWSVDANWKTPVFCSPVNSETSSLTTADNTLNNQNFRQQDIIRDAWKNKRNKNELNYQRQAEEKWMSIAASSAQTPQKKTSFPSVYTSAFLMSAGERKGLHGPCSGCDSLTGTPVSSRAVEPAVPGWDEGGCPCVLAAPSPGLQDTHSSQRVAGSPASCCPSSGTFHRQALSTPCTASPTPPRSAPTCCSGGSTASSAKGTFPSLNAEPQLTWCCLTRSLPLPAQQPGSARSPLHPRHKAVPPERALAKYDMAVVKMKNISRTAACGLTNWGLKPGGSSFPKGQQAQELNSAAPGGAFRNISEQRKKTVVCKKEKLSTNKLKRSHKQKKIKVTPKWYRGRLAHGHAQLKMNGLSKQRCFPNRALDAWKKGSLSQPCRVNRKCHSPQSKVQDQHPHVISGINANDVDATPISEAGTIPSPGSQQNYLHQQQATSRSTSDKPPCRRKKEGKNTSGIPSHTENLNHVKQKHKMDKKFLQDISGQIREHTGTNFSFQNITAPLEIPVPAHSLSAPENAARQAASSEGGICCSGTLQPSLPGGSQPSVPRDSMAPSWPCPSDFMNTGRSDRPGSTASETTQSLRLQGSQENTLNLEPEGPGTLEPLTQVSGREKPPGEANTYPSLKDTSRPSSQPGRSRLFGSNPESAPGAELPSMEHTQQPNFSQATLDLQGSTDGKGGPWQEKSHGQPPATATAAFTKPPGTLRSPERESYSATPSKTYKKRGLEMMRKQSRVEYDDTSSDDEDRLVIEI